MHALRGTRRLLAGIALAAFTIGFVPGPAAAKPWPNTKPNGFKLFAKSFGNFGPNRVSLGLSTRGEVGTDTSGSGTVGGGYWPRGTANQYVFNSGLQVAGVIQGAKSPSNPWGGDTVGAFFFDATGQLRNSAEVTLLYNSANPDDVATWPAAALVPQGDSGEVLFDPLLRGTVSASQGDAWFVSWEGDPAFISGRIHPMGVLAEYRVMGWNFPSGNEDIAYLIVTFYNVTSTNPADYAQHRPDMRTLLLNQATKFQALNNAKYFATGASRLPAGGYTIGPMYGAFSADMDVGNAGNNFVSVNLPFAMGFAYQTDFRTAPGWIFDPSIFGTPFFAGVGFIGTKYLKGPDGPGRIQLFSVQCNTGGAAGSCAGGSGDPRSGLQLFRYLSGTPIVGLDPACNYAGVPALTHICYINHTVGADTRHMQSSTALTIKPGASASIVIAYIFAAPVALAGFTPSSAAQDPGNVGWTNHPDSMVAHNGANRVDSISGFLGYIGQTAHNGDGSEYQPNQTDFRVVPKSLLGKALVAQTVFDNKFLLPFAPVKPDFFLIPGNKQVTILWKPSLTDEASPGAQYDPFWNIANSPTTIPVGGGAPVANSLYDPNYRKFDVEGYRVYRGRTDAPNALRLLAQFDYPGTVFKDYGGNVQTTDMPNCAPELGLGDAAHCNGTVLTKITPGVASVTHLDYDITDPLVQVKYGDRDKLASGTVVTYIADTLVKGGNAGFPPLSNTGVPFSFIDKDGKCASCGVFNGVKYYYSVTAFDVNSVTSAPGSLESPRVTKGVVVGAQASNYDNSANLAIGMFGRRGLLTDAEVPKIDATTGKFSKAFPPSNGVSFSLGAFATELLHGSGSLGMRYDSTVVNSIAPATSANITEWFTLLTSTGGVKLSVPFPSFPGTTVSGDPNDFEGLTAGGWFTAIGVTPADAAFWGGSGTGWTVGGLWGLSVPGAYHTGLQGRYCANNTGGSTSSHPSNSCWYWGPRWFSGANETKDNPNTASPSAYISGNTAPASYNNAGELPGVVTLHHPDAYGYIAPGGGWREVELAMSPYVSAADYKLYWGAAGKIDSVIDVTHDEPVPFNTRIQGSWGVLNASAVPAATSFDARAQLTVTDFGCVAPLQSFPLGNACTAVAALANTVVPGPVAFFAGSNANAKTAPAAANNGFGLYIKGRIFLFELAGGAYPAAGTVWTERDYTGVIFGGTGTYGNLGKYSFIQAIRPFNAPGSSIQYGFTVNNAVVSTTDKMLAKVHTVPDPYYVTSAYDRTTTAKSIKFVNLPTGAVIRIYTASGVLVQVLHNTSTTLSGQVDWNVRNRSSQFVASGVYFYVVEAGGLSRTYRLTIVNYASNIQ